MLVTLLQNLIDFIFRLLPQAAPSRRQSKYAKLVAHRGAHQYGVKENTLKGFELCIEHHIWGIEFDIRWTKDHEPILLHDNNAGHVFDRPDVFPAQLTLSALKKEIPAIPTLAEVVQKFGGKIHFMIELKECFSSHSGQIRRLMEVLTPLQPIEDYHILSLRPAELLALREIPKAAMIGISFVNTREIANIVTAHSMGGHCGFYLFLNQKIKKQHDLAGRKTGVGYVASRNSLYREINRDIEWIYTNQPFEMQDILNELNRN